MIKKILLISAIIFLFIGSACAVNIDDLNIPDKYTKVNTGYYLDSDQDVHLYIGKMSLNPGVFGINDTYYVYSIGDNFYVFEDSNLEFYGVQEKVKINGTDYLISLDKDSPLDTIDKKTFVDELKDFNKENNLRPIQVNVGELV